jgi:hypothetical protein
MSRPTSKKESTELLKFFNSLQKESDEYSEWQITSIISVVYFLCMSFFLLKVFGF